MSMDGKLLLLDFWASPFCMRVKIALREKGVEYESREENLFGGKSELLLKNNPIYQKVPVLFHNAKPICESSIIVDYIDETWPSPPLLPSCPYAKAQAKFWADFIDKKIFDAGSNIWKSSGEAQEEAVKEFLEIIKQLEETLGDNDFFGGKAFGYVDLLAIPLTTWFLAYEKFGGFKVKDHCPKFSAWIKRTLRIDSVSKVVVDPEKVYEFVGTLRKMNGIE